MEPTKKPVEARRKSGKKVLTYEDVRLAARAGNASFQQFVDTGMLAVAKIEPTLKLPDGGAI